jgi:hypothetical protein
MKPGMRAFALSTAVLHLVLCVLGGLLMLLVATFPVENLSPEERAANDWLIGAAVVIVIVALTLGRGVMVRRVALAAYALGAQFIVGAVVIGYAVGESDHADGKLMLYALAVLGTAVAATAASRAEQR